MHTSKHVTLIAAVLLQACGDSGSSADGGMTCAAPDVAVAQDVATDAVATPDVVTRDATPQPDVVPATDVVDVPVVDAPDVPVVDAPVVDVPDVPDGATAPDVVVADASACARWTDPPSVPAAIAVPAGDGGALSVTARYAAVGTQNYTCTATSTPVDGGTADDAGAAVTYAWTLSAPAATLADCAGVVVGLHFASPAGPTAPEWELLPDGNAAIGRRLAATTPDATAIPWLLLQVATHLGSGPLDRAQYLQRVNTRAGLAPSTGCDAAHVGEVRNVPYTADYYFWGL